MARLRGSVAELQAAGLSINRAYDYQESSQAGIVLTSLLSSGPMVMRHKRMWREGLQMFRYSEPRAGRLICAPGGKHLIVSTTDKQQE
jgi:hypothetical protein